MKEFKFIPLKPHQWDFIHDESRYLLNSGGVGSGKTYSICLKTLKLISEYPGIFILLGAKTFPLLRDTTLREFLNICPKEIIKQYNKSEHSFKFWNGSEIIVNVDGFDIGDTVADMDNPEAMEYYEKRDWERMNYVVPFAKNLV